jgi:hypothetical protein
MVKYLFLLYGRPEDQLPEPGTEKFGRMRAEWEAATGAMARAGVLLDCAPLQPPAATTTLSVSGGETLLTDGPAAEIKEHFGGYTLVECADLDEALKWAATLPAAREGKVEVRPVVQMVAANRAVAVAMSEGPAAGLVILDTVGGDARLARWPQLHIARAELLGRRAEAVAAYEAASRLNRPHLNAPTWPGACASGDRRGRQESLGVGAAARGRVGP